MVGAKWRVPMVALAASCLMGCSDDEVASGPCGEVEADTTGCAVVLQSSGADDYDAVQGALIDAASGSDVCFCPGTYNLSREVSLTVPDVTLRGVGATRADTTLDFASQVAGDDGVTVTSDGFTVEHLTVKNTPGNGIVVAGAEDVTFRDIAVSWDAGSVTENGAYAIYPVKSRRVLVENTEVVGAADAGIYVGQSEQAIVRNNVVHGNVAGIEIENTLDAEVYENDAYDNTAGVLVFVLPNLENKVGARALIRDNQITDNNRENFAETGTIVAAVPAGTGMLLLASDDTEIRDNTITGNSTTALFVVSFELLELALGEVQDDPETDPYPERTFFHGNTLSGNGASPQGIATLLEQDSLEDVLWDGVENPMIATGAEFCLGDTLPTFRNFGGAEGLDDPSLHSTDASPHACTLPPLEGVSF